MANVRYTDADGATRESYSSKAGSAGDPDLSPETLHNDLVTIQGYVDGLETAIASTNTKLDTVHTDLGTLLTTGTPITGQSLESGGAGGLGWLSSVRKKLSDLIALLPTALTGSGNFKVAIQERAAPTSGITTRAAINVASSGDNTLIAAVSSQTIRVHKLFLVVSGAVNIKFKDGAGTDFHPALPMQAGGGFVLDFDQEPWFVTSTNTALVLNLSAAVQVSGRIYYTQS